MEECCIKRKGRREKSEDLESEREQGGEKREE